MGDPCFKLFPFLISRGQPVRHHHRPQRDPTHVHGGACFPGAEIVHDLANPIDAISASVQLQEIYLAEGSERLYALITETTQGLKQETARVAALIAELREFSRPLRLNCEPVNFARLVARVIGKSARFLRNHSGPSRSNRIYLRSCHSSWWTARN